MTTPAMAALRMTFPRAEIAVVANPVVGELFQHHPYCDRVIVYDKRHSHGRVGGLVRFSKRLREERFDMAVLFQNAIEAAVMATLARIPRRAGYGTDGRGIFLTHRVRAGSLERRIHHTRYYLNMLKALDIQGGDGRQRLACTDEEQEQARRRLGGDGAWVAINPGAAYGSAKRWLPHRFAAVADSVARELGSRVLLTGGPGETAIGRDIEKAMSTKPLNLIGITTIREMMAVISRCHLMITNDSGPMHVAAAFGVPIVALFGPTDHTTTAPFSDRCRIVRGKVPCAPCLERTCPTDHQCMDAISVAEVLTAIRNLAASS